MPIETLTRRFPSIGSISVGYQDSKPKKNKPGEISVFPRRSKTLVFHCNDAATLEILRNDERVGGKMRKSPTSSDEYEKFDLVSETASVAVHLPPVDDVDRVAPQWLECWASSGLVRRCTGRTCVAHRLPPKQGEKVGDISNEECPCICDAQGLEGDDRCKPVIRLAVVLADFWMDMKLKGVWTVRSGGWGSNSALADELAFYKSMLGEVGGRARFNLVCRPAPSRHGDVPKLHLELDHTPREAAALAGATIIESAALPAAPLDEPVGTFVDNPAEPEPDEPVKKDLKGSATSGPRKPEHEATETAPSSDGGAVPDVTELFGISVDFVGGSPVEPSSDDVVAQAQLTQLVRIGEDLGLQWDQIGALFAARYGFDGFEHGTPASKVTVSEFTDWLRSRKDDQGRLAI